MEGYELAHPITIPNVPISVQGTSLEYVVKVSKHKQKPEDNEAHAATGTGEATALHPTPGADASQRSKEWDPEKPDDDGMNNNSEEHEDTDVEQDVDRLIDSNENEYVLSKSKIGATLTLDPLLIQVRAAPLVTNNVRITSTDIL